MHGMVRGIRRRLIVKLIASSDTIQVYQGDALKLDQIKDSSIDMMLLDPPWDISHKMVINRKKNHKYAANTNISADFGAWDSQWETKQDYLDWTKKWLIEHTRVARVGCHMIIFFDVLQIGKLIDMCKELGWLDRQILVFYKSNPAPSARKVKFQDSTEFAMWFTYKDKSTKAATFNLLGQHHNLVKAPVVHGKIRTHTTQKPEAVIDVWMRYLSKPGDLVLDSFSGSGTVAAVAQKLGRKCIAMDIDQKWAEATALRCNLPIINEDK